MGKKESEVKMHFAFIVEIKVKLKNRKWIMARGWAG